MNELQVRVLTALEKWGGRWASVNELSESMQPRGAKAPTTTLEALERRGFAEHGTSSNGGPSWYWRITDAGRKALAERQAGAGKGTRALRWALNWIDTDLSTGTELMDEEQRSGYAAFKKLVLDAEARVSGRG